MLYFSVKGYIFTKKEPVAHRKRYSHSTTLILKNLRTSQPKNSHYTTIKHHTSTPLSHQKPQLLSTSPLNPHIPNKKYHPTKRKVTFLQTIKFSVLKPSITTSYLKSHNLYILKTYICHYTLRGTIITYSLSTIPVQVYQ